MSYTYKEAKSIYREAYLWAGLSLGRHSSSVLKFWRYNTHQLRNMMLTIPRANLRLDSWRSEDYCAGPHQPDCGTIACMGGWSTWWPYFQSIGLRAGQYNIPKLQTGHGEFNAFQACYLLTGSRELFEVSHGTGGMSHHREAMNRLDKHLAELNRILRDAS